MRVGTAEKEGKRRSKISLRPAVWYDTRYLKWAIWRKEDVAYHNRC